MIRVPDNVVREPAAPPADLRSPTDVLVDLPRGQRTVEGVLTTLRDPIRKRCAPLCAAKGIVYPPKRVSLVAFKQERMLELWAANATGPYRRLGSYAVLAASGGPGPKRREGDLQVPEGIYRLDTLNPNSRFHLSVRVNYPDTEDIANRPVPNVPLGGDIFIHGNRVSIGCLALGDPAIEEVFTLVAQARSEGRHAYIAPWDLRTVALPQTEEAWLKARYARLQKALKAFPSAG